MNSIFYALHTWYDDLYSSNELLKLLVKGGWIMIPILLLSIISVYAIIERTLVLNWRTIAPSKWLSDAYTLLKSGEIQPQHCYAASSLFQAAITHNKLKDIDKIVEQAAQNTVYRLEKRLTLLGTISSVAPMLGFLGTVLGMIQAFMAMSQSIEQVSPQLLSGGIYEAMITTAAGLIVGIVSGLGYNYLFTRVKNISNHLEQVGQQIIRIYMKK